MTSIYEERFPEIFGFVREDKIEVYYDRSRRSFGIGGKEGGIIQEISFCPWTGKKLPPSVSDEFARMLESRDLSALEPETWPDDWKGEEWWIKAGL